jgi:hypothetical protein
LSTHIFGIRHHGPGCARSLRLALEELQPDIVLVEGPSEVRDILPLMIHQDMKPPVALLVYAPEKPQLASFYPFTTFSPEWQALTYALRREIPARFIDLPQAISLARRDQKATAQESTANEQSQTEADPGVANAGQAVQEEAPVPTEETEAEQLQRRVRTDPIAVLAEAAGYADHDLWWEHQIEQRRNMNDLFVSIQEAMSMLRADLPIESEEALREAHMRQEIRKAQKEGFQRIAVVCGAWHGPVLVGGSAREDAALLKPCARIKTATTWIPWTNSRLVARSGYGAGVRSPGWYEHLWTCQDRAVVRWLTRAAHLLREHGLDASSASVIEAVRLSEALAAMRDLAMPGLVELTEAIEAILCHGDAALMNLIRDQLEIGEQLGQVPVETPMVPLQRHLEERQRALRLKPSVERKKLELDLRNETDRARSQFLHQLRLLGINWGEQARVSRSKQGTFHEDWQLQWQVEFVILLIEVNVWGNSVDEAAAAYVKHQANTLEELPKLTTLLDGAILAGLHSAIEHLLGQIQKRAAVSADISHLMDALPPLARVARYSDVRQTRAEHIVPVIDNLFDRIIIGLPGACAALDEDAAKKIAESIDHVHESVLLLDRQEQRNEWQQTLRILAEREAIHGFVRGLACRRLLEQNVLQDEDFQRLTRLALSLAAPADQAAAWIEGVLNGSGLVMLHQDNLWKTLDVWLAELTPDMFIALLPILRRAFANFQSPERQKMGEKVKHLRQSSATHSRGSDTGHDGLDVERAQKVLPILAQIMGVTNYAG